jgi:hypothetical protein
MAEKTKFSKSSRFESGSLYGFEPFGLKFGRARQTPKCCGSRSKTWVVDAGAAEDV